MCFDTVIDANGNGKILMTYSIEGVEKLLPNSDLSGELQLKTAVVSTLNRFIVGNDTNAYEWHTENDTLVRKYNCVYHNCTAFFTNTAKDLAILVHRQGDDAGGEHGKQRLLAGGAPGDHSLVAGLLRRCLCAAVGTVLKFHNSSLLSVRVAGAA